MPPQNAYVLEQKSLSRYYPASADEDDLHEIMEAHEGHELEDLDIPGDVLHERLLNQPVPVTLIFFHSTNLFGRDVISRRRTHFNVSRAAHDENWDVLYDEISDFLDTDDNVIWELSAIHVEATDDEAGTPYPPRLLFNRSAIPDDVLERARFVDLGIVLNRQMNICDYINQALYDLLYHDMLNMTAPDATYHIPHRQWTISMTAPHVQFPGPGEGRPRVQSSTRPTPR
jgi:hypothetical protein